MSSEELRDEIALCGGDMDKIVELVQTDVHNAMGRNRREEARNIYQEYRERIKELPEAIRGKVDRVLRRDPRLAPVMMRKFEGVSAEDLASMEEDLALLDHLDESDHEDEAS